MSNGCNHKWRQVYEESIVGGMTPYGWECKECRIMIMQNHMPPEGLVGEITKEERLVGINGGCGNCRDGSVYKEQIFHEDGTLEIIRP